MTWPEWLKHPGSKLLLILVVGITLYDGWATWQMHLQLVRWQEDERADRKKLEDIRNSDEVAFEISPMRNAVLEFELDHTDIAVDPPVCRPDGRVCVLVLTAH